MPGHGKGRAHAKKPNRRKTAGKSAAGQGKPPVVPQPHGGALYAAGVPGNAGGPGRPPSAVRQACREAFDERIPTLKAIADGTVPLTEKCPACGHEGATTMMPVVDTADRLSAIDKLGRYGLGERHNSIDRESVEESLRIQRRIILEMLPRETADALLKRLADAWE